MPIAFVETVSHPQSEGTVLDVAEFPALPRDPDWELINTGDAEHELDIVPTVKECGSTKDSAGSDEDVDDDGWIEYAPKIPAPSYVQIASKMTEPIPTPKQATAAIIIRTLKSKQSMAAACVKEPEHFLDSEVTADDEMYLAKDKGSQRLHDQAVRKSRERKALAESKYHLIDGRERFVSSDILILPGNMKRRNHELMKSWKWMSKIGKQSSGRGERKKKASGAILTMPFESSLILRYPNLSDRLLGIFLYRPFSTNLYFVICIYENHVSSYQSRDAYPHNKLMNK